jgi:hypothetical protein
MLKTSLAAALILVSTPAWAYCPAWPDGPSSYNVQNGTSLALCQQQELAADNERQRQEREIKTMLQTLDLQQQELRQRLLPVPPLPTPAF